MSDGACIIQHMLTSYWYICTNCDASIEVVSEHIHIQDPTCNCNNSNVVWCQTGVVKSSTTNERNTMLDNLENAMDLDTQYNPNLLVTYKDITDGNVSYPTIKVNDLEWKLENIKNLHRRIEKQEKQIGQVIDNLTVEGWYSPNVDKEDILKDLCEIFEHEAKQEIRMTATVQVSVTYNCPIEDVEDFDAKYFLQDELTVDAYNGDIVIESFDVEDADVDY